MPSPDESNSIAPSLPKRKGGGGARIPLLKKLQARNLYLVQGYGYKEIEHKTGIPHRSLVCLASRDGWTKERQRRHALLVKSADARIEQTSNEVIEAIASESEEIALSALGNARETLQRSDVNAARDFQAYTGGIRNLATTAKALREVQSQAPSAGISMNFFMGLAPSAPIPVSPANNPVIDVEAKTS